MLTLSRFPDEAVLVQCGDTLIRVVVVSIRGSKVRIGFDAPREVRVLREELVGAGATDLRHRPKSDREGGR